ncbi:uncharacterized protein LOC142239994 [Haematobia irritans]|uniref:uncharacterized protein LOC142239994 n=1 Tax=Haematobia irritans TaxID=7368 RepID=UPI003F5069AD
MKLYFQATLYKISVILVILYILSKSQAVKRKFEIVIHNVSCMHYDDVVKHLECAVVENAKNSYVLSAAFELSRTMPNTMDIHIIATIKYAKKLGIIKFLDVKYRVCDIIAHIRLVPFVKQVLDQVTRHSNIPIACPLNAKVFYNISNVVIDRNFLPTYTPIVDVIVTINITYNEKHAAIYKVEGSTIPV